MNYFCYKCPICQKKLFQNERSFYCENNHTHDIAKKGYVNLLMAQDKRSRQPGDSDEMILSRQRFLNLNYYQPLAQALAFCLKDSTRGFQQNVLDLGCGEGYYLDYIYQFADAEALNLAAIDISKRAINEVSKRKTGAQLAVASSKAVPFFDASFDCILSVFAPVYLDEIRRLLTSDGMFIMVGPGEDHLKGLMEVIYKEVFEHKGNYHLIDQDPGFKRTRQIEVKEDIVVTGAHILDLLTMTPYYWHTPPEQKAQLSQLTELFTPIHFYINCYAKC